MSDRSPISNKASLQEETSRNAYVPYQTNKMDIFDPFVLVFDKTACRIYPRALSSPGFPEYFACVLRRQPLVSLCQELLVQAYDEENLVLRRS